jgi:chromate reductase, NAD(P)H dehydrogenase (quinone)
MPAPGAATVTIAAFAGSLRKGSYNRSLLQAAVKLAPPGVRLDAIDISGISLYNPDIENPPPQPVARMRAAIKAANALLVISPEYNYSMSGVTKNVLDWASRPADDSCLDGKPVGVAGCSRGGFGSVRSKLALLPIFVYNNMHVLNDPMLNVSDADTKFDAAGELTDEDTKKELIELLEALAAWARRF